MIKALKYIGKVMLIFNMISLVLATNSCNKKKFNTSRIKIDYIICLSILTLGDYYNEDMGHVDTVFMRIIKLNGDCL